MIVAIGDVHGHYREMQSLLANLGRAGIDFAADTVIWLGDYIDGGPDSALVVATLIELQRAYPHWIFLKGNHEAELISALVTRPHDQAQIANWYHQGGRETLASYQRRAGAPTDQAPSAARHAVPAAHLDWLDGLPCLHESARFAFVHAGLDPRLAAIVDNGPEELLWIRDAFIDSERDWGKRVIFGHTHFREPLVLPNKIGINTMHHHGGRLTGVLLTDDDPGGFRFVQD